MIFSFTAGQSLSFTADSIHLGFGGKYFLDLPMKEPISVPGNLIEAFCVLFDPLPLYLSYLHDNNNYQLQFSLDLDRRCLQSLVRSRCRQFERRSRGN